MVARALDPQKAQLPMDVTESGISIDSSSYAPLNAALPMVSIEFPNDRLVSL
jgi:hypothetical protein